MIVAAITSRVRAGDRDCRAADDRRHRAFLKGFLVRGCAALIGVVAATVMTMSVAVAGTNVAGSIAADATWTSANSPYTVTGDVTVDNGAVLAIEPGVVVFMSAGTSLVINNGGLSAQGTEAQPISITSYRDVVNPIPAPAAGDWGQLRFLSGTNAVSTQLSNVVIKYGSGLLLTAASPTLNNVSILNQSGPAITIDLDSSPVGTGLTATGNGLNGILVSQGELQGNITWGLRGIPYVVSQESVFVGQAPSITSLSPNVVTQGGSVDATVTGVQLAGVTSASASDSHTTVSLLSGATSTFVPVRISADTSATTGTATLTLQVAAGTASVPFTIAAAAANLGVVPSPLAVPPDNSAHNFLVTLSHADTVSNAISLALDNGSIASVSPASGNIPAGQTQSTFQLTGKIAGQTTLRVTSATLGSMSVPVYVTTDYAGINTTYAARVGVQVGAPSPAGTTYSGLVSMPLGVQVGTGSSSGATYSGLVSRLLGVQVGGSSSTSTTYSGLVSPLLGVQVGTSGSTSTTYSGLVSPLLGMQVGASGSRTTTYSGLASQPLGVQVGASGSASTTYSGLTSQPVGIQVGASNSASTTYSGLLSLLLGVQVGTVHSANATASKFVSELSPTKLTPAPDAPAAFRALPPDLVRGTSDALSQRSHRSATLGRSVQSMDSAANSFAVY